MGKAKRGEFGYISPSEKKQIGKVGKLAIVITSTAIISISLVLVFLFGDIIPIGIHPDVPITTALSVGGLALSVIIIIMGMVILTFVIKALDRDGRAKWRKQK